MILTKNPVRVNRLELIEFPSQVAVIDDKRADALPIEDAFDFLNVGNQYFKADDVEPKFPEHPMENVRLVFLDLIYNDNYGDNFNAYICADWLRHVVPSGQEYTLVVWSRDIDNTEALVEAIKETGVTIPTRIESKSKPLYLTGNVEDNISKLLEELGISLLEAKVEINEFFGKIIDIEDDAVIINCLINEDPKIFEVRRFDLKPFDNYMQLKIGRFLKIKTTTKPGSRSIDFLEEFEDLSQMFTKPDVAVNTDNSSRNDWLNI